MEQKRTNTVATYQKLFRQRLASFYRAGNRPKRRWLCTKGQMGRDSQGHTGRIGVKGPRKGGVGDQGCHVADGSGGDDHREN